jgi:6-pyruvoyltetrahydropterin/6-carboxytetrahydropterin synthase
MVPSALTPSTDPEPASASGAILELARADIGFSAAHFSVVAGIAERLHGHNYRVVLRAHGAVHADGTVVDFRALKHALRAECALLDERTLLPTASPTVSVRVDGAEVEVREGARRFVFPRDDVVTLPLVNTTCECLAGYLLAALRARLADLPVRLELSVEEIPGQGATVRE